MINISIEQNDTSGLKKNNTVMSTSDDSTVGQIDIGNSNRDESNTAGNNNSVSGGNITRNNSGSGGNNAGNNNSVSDGNINNSKSSNTGLIVGLSVGGVLVILIIGFLLNRKYHFIKFGSKN